MSLLRAEHPRPQFQRDQWINLNGEWSCKIEQANTRYAQELSMPAGPPNEAFPGRITVPFAPESELSGLGHRDFIAKMWYRRSLDIPTGWNDKLVILHFGAVFYRATIYIDGKYVGQHVGGSVSFALDISEFVRVGASHDLVVEVSKNLWDGSEPSGKQSWKYASFGCFYTRTSGIWQTVWVEAVDRFGLKEVQIIPDVDSGQFVFIPQFHHSLTGNSWEAMVTLAGSDVGRSQTRTTDGIPLTVSIGDAQLWQPGSPVLYDIEFRVLDGSGHVVDLVQSYAGLRKIQIEGTNFLLNDRPIFQRLVLDQGFYPDGVWTAPSDEVLKADIELSMAAGFNGARLHQKVFEERFLYWADKLGYLVWAESASWGLDYCQDGMPHRNFLAEWREVIIRDRNHPSIIAWTPFNETRAYRNPRAHQRIHEEAYHICKSLDPTRPVNDSSGYIHHITDIYTVHNYTQDPRKLSEIMTPHPNRGLFRNHPDKDANYTGQPYYVDEFGGIKWNPGTQADSETATGQNPSSWGYGDAPQSLEEFYDRLEGLVEALMSKEHIAGWCYTQLTDVEQEQNGIYFYDRSTKFDMERIRSIFRMPKSGIGS